MDIRLNFPLSHAWDKVGQLNIEKITSYSTVPVSHSPTRTLRKEALWKS